MAEKKLDLPEPLRPTSRFNPGLAFGRVRDAFARVN